MVVTGVIVAARPPQASVTASGGLLAEMSVHRSSGPAGAVDRPSHHTMIAPRDVSDVERYFVSGEGRYVTGTTFSVAAGFNDKS